MPPAPPGDVTPPAPPAAGSTPDFPAGEPAPAAPNPYAAYVPPGTATASAPAPGRGLAIAALIVGILALLGFWIPFVNVISLVMAIVGLILGIVALRKYLSGKGLPLSAVIVNAVALLLSGIFVALYTVGFLAVLNSSTPFPPSGFPPATIESDDPIFGDGDGDAGGDDLGPGSVEDVISLPTSGPGSLAEPLAIGETVVITDGGEGLWEVALSAVELDGSAAVAAASDSNEAPPAGYQYGVLTLSITNISGGELDPWYAIEAGFQPSADRFSSQFDVNVVDPAPSLFDVGIIGDGETTTANTAVLIPSEGAADGAWIIYSYWDLTGFAFEAQ
ncbi:hypothetical protein EV141_0312 [Microcella putealis]|uniref:DUF4190 domain-containing protein n=1 Tax=Microcella putealis TaxID=337005 RepID=A0A4Q7LVG7_9MICO|nr:hypothetical protein EV141_0312 [Microcella putealis]TQM24121.1 hypothetical protein BJ957_1591 [Microcella putealis]